MNEKIEGRKPGGEGAAVIGGGIVITGDVACAGEMQIGGQVIGDVRCATLFIDEAGEVKGNVQAERLRLSGIIDGAVDVGDLAIEATGQALGTVTYERLKISAGGMVNGTLRQREVAATRPADPSLHKVVDLDAAKPRRVYVD